MVGANLAGGYLNPPLHITDRWCDFAGEQSLPLRFVIRHSPKQKGGAGKFPAPLLKRFLFEVCFEVFKLLAKLFGELVAEFLEVFLNFCCFLSPDIFVNLENAL